MEEYLLTGKIMVVAGTSASAIFVIAKKLLEQNATVVVPVKSANEIAALKEWKKGKIVGKLVTLLTDYPDYDKVLSIAETIREEFGTIDMAVLCFEPPSVSTGIMKTDLSDWEKMIEQNITSFFIAARIVLENMKLTERGVFITIDNARDIEEHCGSVISNLSSSMQTEMARIFANDVKPFKIRNYHIALSKNKPAFINDHSLAEFPEWQQAGAEDLVLALFQNELFVSVLAKKIPF